MKHALALITACFALALTSLAEQPATVHLTWIDPNNVTDIDHYCVYYGKTSGSLSNFTEIPMPEPPPVSSNRGGNVTIASSGIWFFHVTAVGTNGLESLPSNEVSTEVVCKPETPTNLTVTQIK